MEEDIFKFSILDYIQENEDYTIKNTITVFSEHVLKYAEIRPQLSGWIASIYNMYKNMYICIHKKKGKYITAVKSISDDDFMKAILKGAEKASGANNGKSFNINIVTNYFKNPYDIANKEKVLQFLNDYNNDSDYRQRDKIEVCIYNKDWDI